MAGLARFDIRFRYVIIAFWVIAGALCLAFFPSLSSAVNTDNSSFLPGSSPSVHALHLAGPFQPVNDTTGTLVVLGRSKLSSSDQQQITKLQNKIAKDDHVVSVSDQGLSKDGQVSKAQLVLDVQTSSTDAAPTVAGIRSTMSSFHLPSGLSSYLTGQLPSAVDNQNSQASAQKLTENLSVLIILIMLIIVFRAVAAPLVTLLPAIWVLLMSGEHHRRGVQGRPAGVHHHPDHADRAAARRGHRLRRVLHHAGARGDGGRCVTAHRDRAGRPVHRRVDHVLRGHGHRGAAHPAAGHVRAVLGARPGAGPRGLPDAAGRADPASRPGSGAGPGPVLAAPGPARQPGRGVCPARRRGDRAPRGHAGRRGRVPGRARRVHLRIRLERFRRPDHWAVWQPVGPRHQRDQQALPGSGRQPHPGADGLPDVGVEEPHPGQQRREPAGQEARLLLGQRPVRPERHQAVHQPAEQPVRPARPAREAARRRARRYPGASRDLCPLPG